MQPYVVMQICAPCHTQNAAAKVQEMWALCDEYMLIEAESAFVGLLRTLDQAVPSSLQVCSTSTAQSMQALPKNFGEDSGHRASEAILYNSDKENCPQQPHSQKPSLTGKHSPARQLQLQYATNSPDICETSELSHEAPQNQYAHQIFQQHDQRRVSHLHSSDRDQLPESRPAKSGAAPFDQAQHSTAVLSPRICAARSTLELDVSAARDRKLGPASIPRLVAKAKEMQVTSSPLLHMASSVWVVLILHMMSGETTCCPTSCPVERQNRCQTSRFAPSILPRPGCKACGKSLACTPLS